jgi:hypothetical protein
MFLICSIDLLSYELFYLFGVYSDLAVYVRLVIKTPCSMDMLIGRGNIPTRFGLRWVGVLQVVSKPKLTVGF